MGLKDGCKPTLNDFVCLRFYRFVEANMNQKDPLIVIQYMPDEILLINSTLSYPGSVPSERIFLRSNERLANNLVFKLITKNIPATIGYAVNETFI